MTNNIETNMTSGTEVNYTKNATIATPSNTTRVKVEPYALARMSDNWTDVFESILDVSKGSVFIRYDHEVFLNHRARREIEAILNGE